MTLLIGSQPYAMPNFPRVGWPGMTRAEHMALAMKQVRVEDVCIGHRGVVAGSSILACARVESTRAVQRRRS